MLDFLGEGNDYSRGFLPCHFRLEKGVRRGERDRNRERESDVKLLILFPSASARSCWKSANFWTIAASVPVGRCNPHPFGNESIRRPDWALSIFLVFIGYIFKKIILNNSLSLKFLSTTRWHTHLANNHNLTSISTHFASFHRNRRVGLLLTERIFVFVHYFLSLF